MKLQLQNLCRSYGENDAVQDVNIEFRPGIYGLLGDNGAGKTTLMKMSCGVLKPTGGRICLDDRNIKDLGEQDYAHLGYMPQDFGFYPDFTAREFLFYMAAVKGIETRSARDRIEEVLEIVNLSEVADKKIKSYSGGMKRRLGIAQAELNQPAILILDEPTAGLDPRERVRFRNLISDFSKEKIVILSTHIVSDVSYIADYILMMQQGKIFLQGSTENVIDSIRGNVWEVIVDEREVEKYIEKFCIVNRHHEGNQVRLRIVGNTAPSCNASMTDPSLEDLFLYHFGKTMQVERSERYESTDKI